MNKLINLHMLLTVRVQENIFHFVLLKKLCSLAIVEHLLVVHHLILEIKNSADNFNGLFSKFMPFFFSVFNSKLHFVIAKPI